MVTSTNHKSLAEKKYDLGASDTEIKIGQTMPYSGAASAYGTAGRAEAAYFAKINAEGGVNGRKIQLISLDDAYQSDDYGKDYLKAFKGALGDKAGKMIVAEASYEVSDPGIDSQIISLKSSGADTLLDLSTPKFAAQAIRKAYDIDWHPLHFIPSGSTSIPAVMRPAGLDKSAGVISAAFLKDPSDPQWKDDPAVKEWLAWIKKYYADGDIAEQYNVYGYSAAQTLVQVLKQCRDDLTRENIMHQAANLKDLQLPMLLPGIKINTSPTDYSPIKQMQLQRFDGTRWVRFGDVLGK